MARGNALLGASEVNALVGTWQSIIGSGAADPFRDILGTDVYQRQARQQYRPSWQERERDREDARRDAWRQQHGNYGAPSWQGGGGWQGGGWQRPMAPTVRDHIGASALLGAAADAINNGADPGTVVAQVAEDLAIPPRNQLVDRPGPTRADRVLLPMSSGVSILPNTSAQITSRPQNVAFRPERVIIGGAAGDWIVNDVKVGNRSQYSQSGDVPGEVFAATTIDSFVSFETVQTAMDFVMLVTYIGASESGAPFYCAVLGTAAI